MSSNLFNLEQIRTHLASARLDDALLQLMAEQVWLRLHERLLDIQREFQHIWLVTHFPEPILTLWKRDMGDMPVRLLNPLQLDDALPEEQPDCILIAGVLHQINDADAFLAGLSHLMQPDGAMLLCVPGGSSYQELQQVLMHAEESVRGGVTMRMHPMLSIQSLGAMLQQANLQLPVMDAEMIELTYPDLTRMLHDLRGMGQQYALAQAARAPLSHEVIEQATQLYIERYASVDGRLPVTIEWLSATAWTHHASQPKPAARGSGVMNLADALNKH